MIRRREVAAALDAIARRYGGRFKAPSLPVSCYHWRAGRARTGGIPWTGRKRPSR